MSVMPISEGAKAAITDADKLRFEAVLKFWFKEQ